MRDEGLVREARRLARLLEKPGIEAGLPELQLGESIGRDEACRVVEGISALVKNYRSIEEGGMPSNAYLALEAAGMVFEKLCRGEHVDDELVALALGVLGLLEAGRTARAAAVASMIASRLRRTP